MSHPDAAPIAALKARHLAALAAQGLDVVPGTWGYDPAAGADVVHVILSADPALLAAPIDQVGIDADFAAVVDGDRAAADDAAVAAVRADLTRRLADGGSILDD